MISDDQFRRWLKQDNRAARVWTTRLNYQDEESGGPITRTLALSNKPYRRGSERYYAIIQQIPEFYRELGGDKHGVFSSSYGKLVIDARGGEFDWLMDAAIDGSDIAFSLGDLAWPIDDHRLIFAAKMVNVSRADTQSIDIELQDSSILLNKSISGQVLVGGTGPSADKPRAFNFGIVRQVELDPVEASSLTYSHSDTGENTVSMQAYDRLQPVGANDNGDGTVTLDAFPDGKITADVIATAPGADPSDTTRHLVSDLLDVVIGQRSGLAAEGLYAGPHPTFTIGDFEDYPIGVSVKDTRNTITFLADAAVTGQFAYAVTRLGPVNYLRIRPNDVASLPMVPFDVNRDDVLLVQEPTIANTPPGYYRIRARANLNWTQSDDVATGLDPDDREARTRKGYPFEQDNAVGTTYADSPELYDLTLVESPIIDTWISDDNDETADLIIRSWAEVERFNGLPWLRHATMTVGMEFFEKELGDVARITFPFFRMNAGILTQVVRIRLRPTDYEIDLTFFFRSLSQPYPIGWERITTADVALSITSFEFDSTSGPPVVPPPIDIPPGIPPLGPPVVPPWTDEPTTPVDSPEAFLRESHFVGRTEDYGLLWQGVVVNSAGTLAVAGISTDHITPSFGNIGRLDVYEASSPFALIAQLFDTTGSPDTALVGFNVDIADDDTIVCSEGFVGRYHIFTRTGPTTWSDTFVSNTPDADGNFDQRCVINADGDVAVFWISGPKIVIWKKDGLGTWGLQQTIDIAPDNFFDVDISGDGMMIATSGYDTVASGPPNFFPGNLNVRIYLANFGRTSWTLSENITPTSENGNTRIHYTQKIALAKDQSLFVATAPNDQDFVHGGTIFVYQRGIGFSKIAWLRLSDASAFSLSVALSADGSRLFIGDPLWVNVIGDGGTGRAWYVDRPDLLSGGPLMIDTDPRFIPVVNPYAGNGSTNVQGFGNCLSVSDDGTVLAVGSRDFGDSGATTVDFLRRGALPAAGVQLFFDDMGGTVGTTFVGRTPAVGGAYTAENGNLSDAVLDGSGNLRSSDTSAGGSSPYPASDITPPTYNYKLSTKFTVTDDTAATATIDVAGRIAADDTWLIELYLFWNSTTWSFGVYVANADGSEVYSDSFDVTAAITTGVEHEISAEVVSGGAAIAWKVDGVLIALSAAPDVFPDSVTFGNNLNNATIHSGAMLMNEVQLITTL